MKIETRTDIPDSTYFTMSDVEPFVDGKKLIVFDGKGSRRSWGKPEVDSTIVINTRGLVAIHVGFHHKHRGSQGWFYFVKGERQTWAQLPDKLRQKVLDAFNMPYYTFGEQGERLVNKARVVPSWARCPGKLNKERNKIDSRIGYKLVKVLKSGQMVSVYDGSTEYTIGKRMVEAAQTDHGGGYYSFPDIETARKTLTWGISASVQKAAILKVRTEGKHIHYENGKIASTYLTPLEVVEYLEKEPAAPEEQD